jgi:3,2-trans-enoyl-CoA isomerase
MTTLALTTQASVLRIQLDRGTANPIDRTMVTDLRAAIQHLQDSPELQGALLTGKPGFFSAGLDVLALYAYDEAEMAAFWGEFSALIYELAACPKPIVAAISGHSPAGGCVLALCCDARLMAEGNYKIGLNEVPVGIVVPESIYHLYAQTVGQRQAYQFLMAGKMLTPTEALQAGLVDQVVPLDTLEAAASEHLAHYLKLDAATWQGTKRNLRRPLLEQLRPDPAGFEATLKHWWTPAARAALEQVVQRLKKR